MKALLVDPDPQRAPVLAAALDAGGAEVSVAPSASFALTMLEWNKQDVIISRARLGDMEGHELCAIVRSDPSTKDVRFVLVVGNGEAAPAQAAVAGVDLVLPDALSSATIVTRVVQLVRRQMDSTAAAAASVMTPAATAPPRTIAPPPPRPALPRPIAPPPPRAVAPPPIAPPPLKPVTPPPIAPPPLKPVAPPPPIAPPLPRPVAPPLPSRPVPPAPVVEPTPVVASAAPAAMPTPSMAGLEAVGTNGGTRTFQGALGVLEIEELTQAIAVGGKTGRLVLVLTTGGGLVVFESGRVTHAEYGGQAGEPAFGALVAASHRERGGKFCFIPVHPNELRSQPKTIVRPVDQLLLDVARSMDEEKRA